jgi:hypothetical protein
VQVYAVDLGVNPRLFVEVESQSCRFRDKKKNKIKDLGIKGTFLNVDNSVLDTTSHTSEDECKWYWHQMIYFPGTRIQSGAVFDGDTLHTLCYSFVQCTATLTLCITGSCSHNGAVFCVLGHLAMSSLLHCPESTAAHHPSLEDRGPLPPR